MKFVVTEPRENLVKVRVYTEGKSLNEIVKVLENLTPAFGNAQLITTKFGTDFIELYPDSTLFIAMPIGTKAESMTFKERLINRLLDNDHEVYEPRTEGEVQWTWEDPIN